MPMIPTPTELQCPRCGANLYMSDAWDGPRCVVCSNEKYIIRDDGPDYYRDVCDNCGQELVVHEDFEYPFCPSWLEMEGGCPPAPVPKIQEK